MTWFADFHAQRKNHSVNGMQLDESSNTLYLAVGGSTNAGSPSQNFASLTEYAYSCAILAIDLDAIDALPTQTDFGGSSFYKYDLPTLDDPDRETSSDLNDPWGGNDGLNQAKLVVGRALCKFMPQVSAMPMTF